MWMAPTSTTRTLYDDWSERRERLRASSVETPNAALHLRVLNYLLDRYREEAATLDAAPPLLDAVLVNHRAIVVNHHCGLGQVAGVKSRNEASGRMAHIVQRMHDCAGEDHDVREELHVPSATYVERPAMSYSVASRWALLDRRRGPIRRETAKIVVSQYPFLPHRFIERLSASLLEFDCDVLEIDIELLESCHNASAATALVDGWRRRVEVEAERVKEPGIAGSGHYDPLAARELAKIVARLEQGIIRHKERAAKRLRPLLADENAQVRLGVYRLLRHVGSLRDVALLSDLLELESEAGDDPRERLEIAETMHWIVRRSAPISGEDCGCWLPKTRRTLSRSEGGTAAERCRLSVERSRQTPCRERRRSRAPVCTTLAGSLRLPRMGSGAR